MFKLIRSLLKSAVQGIEDDPELKKLEKKHPKITHFMSGRLNKDSAFGLTLTIGVLVSGFFLYLFFGILQDVIGLDPLARADLRLINLVQFYRTPLVSRIMLFFTYLGSWQVVFFGLALVSIIYYLQKRWGHLIAIIASVAGGELFVFLLKNLFHRARPPLSGALVIENSFSFPSGHSMVAISFYGLLTYFLFAHAKNAWEKTLYLFAGLLTIVMIAFSRIYLGVHWPSDVLAGLAVGAAWAVALITAINVREKLKGQIKPKNESLSRKLGFILFLLWFGFVSIFYVTHPFGPIPPAEHPVKNLSTMDVPAHLFDGLPKTSETITGQAMEPINVVVVSSREELERAFSGAGWIQNDQVGVKSLWKALIATILKKTDPTAPGTPSFWDTRPNDFAYEKPTPKNVVSERNHIHFWSTNLTMNGTPVWFATAHFDKSIVFKSNGIPTHEIDPDVDMEREKVKGELESTGLVSGDFEFQIVDRELGKNASGSLFFTDGKAVVIYLK